VATTFALSTTALVVLLLGWQTRERNRDYVSDERIWRDTIAKQPSNPRAHMALGADLVIAGRYDEAAAELETSLRLDPNRPETLSNLGLAELKLGRIDASVTHLERAVALRPEYAAAHRNLAQAYLARHEDRLAAQHFRRALDSQPDHAPTLKDLGLLLAVTGDDDLRNGGEARALAERAVALTGRRDPASLIALGAALAELDRFDEAVAVLREAHALPTATVALAAQLSQMEEAYAARRRIRRSR
jgi:tetratricopeptide (TPR) repeat protein